MHTNPEGALERAGLMLIMHNLQQDSRARERLETAQGVVTDAQADSKVRIHPC